MCGIAGIILKHNSNSIEDDIKNMLSTIRHRGPDGEGLYIKDDRIGLGHRRLSIIDLSDNGRQPMSYLDRYHITFNGEIYNYIEIRSILEKKGYVFSTHTDTEVLLASYHEWGERCVDRFNGMWSFAIYDERTETIFCSRDRYGVKPFYYYEDSRGFFFGSEIKELLKIIPGKSKPDKEHVAAYLSKGALDYDEGTMFKGVYQLIGGYNLKLDCNSLQKRIVRYYNLKDVLQNTKSREENYRIFRDKFFKAIQYRLRSDVAVGSCLSGGLDSSSIVCVVNELRKKDGSDNIGQATVSSCFEDKKYDEQEYIDEVLKKTGIIGHKVFPDMDRLFEKLDKIIWHMDEPFAGTSMYAQWCVFEEAKKRGLTVMLDGQGSDEQLAGYTPFYKVLFIELLKRGKWGSLKREINAYKKLRSDSEPVPFSEILLSTITSFLFPDWIRFKLNRLYVKRISGLPFEARMYKTESLKNEYRKYNKRNYRQYIYASMHDGMRSLLHYEDRNSMAHSIESRVPFLDYELAEFIYSVPIDHKIVNGRTKNLIREGLKDYLPGAIYNRISKLGFVTPEDKWIKENEEFFFGELERACDRLNGFVDKERVLSWYRSHIQATRRGDTTCFRIICCAHWANVFDVDFENE